MYAFVFAAGAAALYFMVEAIRRRGPAQILAVILWAAYAIYEYYVANGTLCDPYCNIRVDLVLFLPLLGWATYLALQKGPRTGCVAAFAVVCLAITAGLASLFGYVSVSVIAGILALVVAAYGVRSALKTKRA